MITVGRFWRDRNLRESPFFQSALEPGHGEVRYPIDLFVGRSAEAKRILSGIEAADQSRNAVQGAPGVGKTTLVQHVKERASHVGIASTERWVSLGSAAELEDALLQILGEVYHALLGVGGMTTPQLGPMKLARQLLLAYETKGGGISLGFPGLGSVGVSRSASPHTGMGAVLVQVPRLLNDLAHLAHEHASVNGILVHLNNLENLAEADAKRAGQILRDLRDHCLMIPGLHYIVAGTEEAVRAMVSGQPQLRSVFGVPEVIEPLSPPMVHELLERRYDFLKIDSSKPVPPLVTEESLDDLYRLFRGDLRSTFQALEEASKRIAALGDDPTDVMDPEALRDVLRNIYQRMVRARLDPTLLGHAEALSRAVGGDPFTRNDLTSHLEISERHGRTVLTSLRREGIIQSAGFEPAGGPGRPAATFVLTGVATLAFEP